MCNFHFGFLSKFLELFCEFEFCGGTSVLTMSPQDKIRKLQRKSAFMPMLWRIMTTICKDGGIDVSLLDEDDSSIQISFSLLLFRDTHFSCN